MKFNSRLGLEGVNYQGFKMKIIRYKNAHDIDVQFEDEYNTIYKNKKLGDFVRGKIKNPNYLLGETNISNQGYLMRIIGGNTNSLDILMDEKIVLNNIRYELFKSGKVKNPYHKGLFGIGYIGIGDFETMNGDKQDKIYIVWKSMLERCYSHKNVDKNKTYVGCSVDEYFHCFQNFAQWYKDNTWSEDCLFLDKDILYKGNKIYSPDTCCIVDRKLNNMFTNTKSYRGKYAVGVKYRREKFESTFRGNFLGTFDSETDAFIRYKKEKEDYYKLVAEQYKNKYHNFPQSIYNALVSYTVNFDD